MTAGGEILVTGLTGLVGQHLRAAVAGRRWVPLTGEGGHRVDILDADAVTRALDAAPGAVVVHLAAFTDVTAAWRQDGDRDGSCYRINVIGTRNVARACRAAGRFLVHVSSDYVFSGDREDRYDELAVPDAHDWYGVTKLLAEQEVRRAGAAAAIVRLAYPFGPGRIAGTPDLVGRIRARLRDGDPVALFADTAITPTYLPDFARCVDVLADRRQSGVFHAVGSTTLSPYELGRAVARAAGLEPERVLATSHAEHVRAGNRPYPRRLELGNAWTADRLRVHLRTVPEALADLMARAGSPGRSS